jgi:hypothetical protein
LIVNSTAREIIRSCHYRGDKGLRLALCYRGLSAVSFLVGVGTALAGVGVGLGETLSISASEFPSRTDEAMAAANLPVALGSSVVGVTI